MARVGIRMPDGNSANGIGRCRSMREFVKKANHGNTTILVDDSDDKAPYCLEIEARKGNRAKVSASIWRSWTGRRFIDGNEVKGERFMFAGDEVYTGKVAA